MEENEVLFYEDPYALFYICYDNDIFLKEANESYLRLYGLNADDIGKDIGDILSGYEAAFLHSLAERYRGEEFVYRYVKRFDGCDFPFKIRISLSHPNICYSGTRLFGKCGERNQGAETAISFIHTENGFEAEAVGALSEETRNMLLCRNICRHKGLEELLKETFGDNESRSRIVNISGGGMPDIVRLTAIPLNGRRGRSAIVTINEISLAENENDSIHKLSDDIIAVALVSCRDREHMYFENISPLMEEMIEKKRLTGKQLTESYPFESAMSQGSISVGKLCFGKEGESFLLAAMPVIEDGAAVHMLIAVLPVENGDMMDRSLLYSLTSREYNVMSLAVKGMNTRDIGNILNTSEGTVKKQLFSCYKKLDVNNRVEMIKKLYHL